MAYAARTLPTAPDPVVPSIAVQGLLDDDGLPGGRTLFAVSRSVLFMKRFSWRVLKPVLAACMVWS